MRKIDALYGWLLVEINRLSDSDTAEDFADTLVDPALSTFTDITEEMRGYSADIATARSNRQHFPRCLDLKRCVEAFKDNFPTFPDQVFQKLLLFLVLADKLSQTLDPLDATPVDENLFEIRFLPNPLPLCWYSYENHRSFEDSVAVICCDDFTRFQQEIKTQNISPHCLYHLLAALSQIQDICRGHHVWVKKCPATDVAAIDAFTRLNILMAGKTVHSPRRYTLPLSIINRDSLTAGQVYHQWHEVINVLSEYNSRDEVLAKYLTLYHIFENLMQKLPIVELERQQSGRMFTIRDFRRLYQYVDAKEHEALKRLFDKVLRLQPIPGGSTFSQLIYARWQALTPATPTTEIEDAVNRLGVKKSQNPFAFNDFNAGAEGTSYFTSMVYQTRCAIVHNKETEFHLTYANLNNGFVTLIEKFLIPSLEELCFFLISVPNAHVWYSQKELLLYQ